ncbi:MAG: glycerate kinase [Bacilli bacterium]|nr:glycerate kinase [Bacilli bacterium]
MKRVLIASDSFKGTLSSSEIISLCSKVVREKFSSEISLSSLLIADGGEGSLDAICSFLQGERIQTKAIDSCERMIETEYFYQREEKTAFIEVAKVLSLPHVDPSFPKRKRTTRGVGMLIRDAIQKGAKRIYLFLRGTSTNDIRIYMLEELGVKFNVSHVSAESLLEITDFSTEAFDSLIQGVEFIGLSDVENPLLGNQGATYVFGPQKGYSKDLCLLEEGMSHFASLIKEKKGIDVSFQKGAGAAGVLGACIISFFH